MFSSPSDTKGKMSFCKKKRKKNVWNSEKSETQLLLEHFIIISRYIKKLITLSIRDNDPVCVLLNKQIMTLINDDDEQDNRFVLLV